MREESLIGHEQEARKEKRIEKGKRGFFGIVFGRTAVVFLLLVLQAIIVFIGFSRLSNFVYYLNAILKAVSLILVVHIINKKTNPAFMLSWVIIILIFPVFGTLLYLFIQMQLSARWINRKLQKLHIATKKYWNQNEVVHQNLERENARVARLVEYIYNKGGYPVYQNTSAKYFPDGISKFNELVRQLELAQEFIFMEYFIVDKGYMWESILEILKRKVKEGVEVRFMYDGMCSLARLPYNYPKQMETHGIKCHMFSPVMPAFSTHQNNRDHRKIVVIDGHIAFTGGINLADEYINKKVRFGYWKDTAIMLQGEAVRSFTIMFLEMWNVGETVNETFDRYLDVPQLRVAAPGDGFVIPYGDSPLDNEQVGEQVYLDILYTAKKYVHIMTPYLIPDHDMITALTYAAKRGVEVIIMMPHIPDKWYAFVLAKTYYNELIEAGVQIYEYTPGFVHAKVFTSDDSKAVVGTINLDFRSLYLHFECAVLLFENHEISKIEEDFQTTLEACQKIGLDDFKMQNLFNQLAGKVMRILAPLM